MKKRRILAMLLAATMLFSMTACGAKEEEAPEASEEAVEEGEAAEEAVGYESTVYTAYTGDLDTADPYGSTSAPCAIFTNLTFDTLNYMDADTAELCPELATSWEAVDDTNMVWEIKLVEGATFHNGAPFTAEDVKFTFEYANPEAGNVIKTLAIARYVESMDIVDDYTIRFNLNTAMPDFPTYLEAKIYSKTAFDEMDAADAAVIGTGPYYFDTELTQSGSQYAGTRYDNYWGGIEDHPTEHIVIKYIADENTRNAAFEAGELDILFYCSASSYSLLEGIDDAEILTRDGANSYYMGFNYARDYMKDVEVRKALAQALNKDDIVAIAYEGGIGGGVSNNLCIASAAGYVDVNGVTFDAEAAKAVLEEKGVAGKKLVLAHYPSCTKMAEVIQANYAAVGLQIELKLVDSANWTAFKSAQQEYDLFLDYCGYQGALLYNFDRFFHSAGSSNVYGYANAEYDELQAYVQAGTTYDEMLNRFGELQQFVAEDIPTFPLVVNKQIAAVRNDVEGFKPAPSNNYMDFSTVYIPAR